MTEVSRDNNIVTDAEVWGLTPLEKGHYYSRTGDMVRARDRRHWQQHFENLAEVDRLYAKSFFFLKIALFCFAAKAIIAVVAMVISL